MSVPDWLREGGLHKWADRLNFTGRRDDVDPSPGPEGCADTDCMTLRDLAQLAAVQHEFISAYWEIKHKRCEHGSCKSLRMAAALMEKYEGTFQTGYGSC